MSSWENNQEITIGRIKDLVQDIEVSVTAHLMHNGHPYKEFVCQVEFPHPTNCEKIVELARIDKSHGFLHLDELWKKNKGKSKLHEKMDVWDAAKHLKSNWQSYFRKWSNREDTDCSSVYELDNLE